MTWLLTAWGFAKKVPAWLWGALGVALALLLAYWRGKGEGRASERQKAEKRRVENMETRDEVEDELRKDDPAGRRDRLRGWVSGDP